MRMAFSLLSVGAIAVSALASSGCNDTVPPSAQGALSYRVWKATGQGCFVPAHSANAPDLGRGQNVTGTSVGATAVDGRDGARIQCQVKPQGDSSYIVTAELDLGDVSFSLDSIVAAGQADASGSVRLQDNNTVAAYVQPALLLDPPTAPCKVSVQAKKNQQYGIEKGWVWGTFICDNIVDERSPEAFCSAEGTFLFENCDE